MFLLMFYVPIYKSPPLNNNEFLACINNILKNDNSPCDRTILIGDMNINIIGRYLVSENVNNEYLDMLSSNGFYSLINVHTRLRINKTHSCIDHIFIKCSDEMFTNTYNACNVQAHVIQIDITDHCPIITSIPLLKY